jgi:hypothetical protein
MHFGSLDFIITMEGGLEQIHGLVRPARTANLDPLVEAFEGMWLRTPEDRASKVSGPLDFNYESLGRQLRIFLVSRPTQEDLRLVLFLLANVTAQLSGGEPLSLEIPTRGFPMRFLFGLRNADGEFVGMTDYVSESFHDLLVGESEVISDSFSSGGSHHPLRSVSWQESPKGVSKTPTQGKLLRAAITTGLGR